MMAKENLYLSVPHWEKQLVQQRKYIQSLTNRKKANSVNDRFIEVLESAQKREEYIKSQIHILTYVL